MKKLKPKKRTETTYKKIQKTQKLQEEAKGRLKLSINLEKHAENNEDMDHYLKLHQT